MMKRLFNLGIKPDTLPFERVVIKLSNQFGLVEFVVSIGIVVVFSELFAPIIWIPIIAGVFSLIGLALNGMYLTRIARTVLVLSPVICWSLANAYITPVGEKPVLGLMAFSIVFAFLPFVIFSYRDWLFQIIVFALSAVFIVFFGYLNEMFESDAAYYAKFNETFEFLAVLGAVLTLFGIGLSQFASIRSVMRRNYKLIEESEHQKLELHQQQREIKKTIKELEQSRKEDEIRNWISNGIAEVGQILRTETDHDKMYDRLIRKLVSYTKANQGGLYLYNEDEGCLELTAMYAYDRKKFVEQKIDLGSGLIGQAYLEKDLIYITEVPNDYVRITSGLGEATPTSLLIAPMIANEKTEAIVELAFFHTLKEHELDFIRQLGEEIALVIASNRLNQATRELLEQSQQQAEEMKAQEEEMRQNMEELEATQEEMARAQKEINYKQSNLNALINSTEDSIIMLDRDYKAIIINQKVKDRYKGTQYEGIDEGFNVLEMLGNVREEWKGYYDRALAGEKLNFIIKSSVQGENSWREYFIKPMCDNQGVINGISVFSRDVSKVYQTQQELLKKEKLLEAIMDSSDDTFFAIDKDYKITVVNKVLRDRFAQAGIELRPGFDIMKSLSDDQIAFWKPKYDRILSGEHFIFEHDRPIKDKVLYLEVHCTPIKNENGEVIGASVLSKDITHWKELRDEKEKLENLLKK